MNAQDEIWPPNYIVKRHPRARHVKLRTSLKKGLELVVPPKFNIKHIPEILLKNKTWIKKQLDKLQLQQTTIDDLPNMITLPLLNQTWKIHYIEADAKLRLISRPHQELVIIGKIANKLLCRKLLMMWIMQLAKMYLPEYLQKISQKIHLPYRKLTLRNQQTRWGSCTKSKAISLNYKILFLPPHLAEHILIHELCHTVHLNHSEKFWQLVESFDPHWQTHRRLVKQDRHLVPGWFV